MTETIALPVLDACWSRIGVRGDRSCPKLQAHIHCHNCEVFSRAAQTLLDRPARPEYVAELTELVAEPAATRKLPDQSVVLFRVGSEGFAIPTSCVVELTHAEPPRRVPHRDSHVFGGLIKIRGRLELCVSLHGLLGISMPDRSSTMLSVLLVQIEGERWAWLIDSVVGVHRYDSVGVLESPTAAHKAQSYVSGLIRRNDELHGLLDTQRIREKLLESLR